MNQHDKDDLIGLLVIVGGCLVVILILALISHESPQRKTTVTITYPTTTTTAPTQIIDAVTIEHCEEDEVLVPVEYGPTLTRYICVTLDDFASPDSIDRLDAILAERN